MTRRLRHSERRRLPSFAGLAPVEIRYAVQHTDDFSRRLVVQLPDKARKGGAQGGSSTKAVQDSVIFGLPGDPKEKEGPGPVDVSGWLIYTSGAAPKASVGSRAFGRAVLASEVEETTRSVSGTEPGVGRLQDVQRRLTAAATGGVPISRLLGAEAVEAVEAVEAGAPSPLQRKGSVEPPTPSPLRKASVEGSSFGQGRPRKEAPEAPLLQAIVADADPDFYSLYEEMSALLLDAPGGDVEQVDLEPAGLFHVAIDCPGYGKTGGSNKSVKLQPASLIGEVIAALAKQYALALVGSSLGAAAVFSALLEQPSLASFIAVREPFGQQIERYSSLLHPTVVVVDKEDRDRAKIGRQLKGAMLHVTYDERSSRQEPRFEDARLAQLLLHSLRNNHWRGQMHGLGASTKLPLLTRLAGGIHAWRAEASAPKGAAPGATVAPTGFSAHAYAAAPAPASAPAAGASSEGGGAEVVAATATIVVESEESGAAEAAAAAAAHIPPAAGSDAPPTPQGALLSPHAAKPEASSSSQPAAGGAGPSSPGGGTRRGRGRSRSGGGASPERRNRAGGKKKGVRRGSPPAR